ncbi:MAG: MFS transporter [Pseudomonadota bacterium]
MVDLNAPHATSGRWWLLAGVWLLYACFGLIAASIAPLVLQIENDLHISHIQMGSVMGAWQLVYIFSALPCGALLDRIGVRSALVLGGGLLVLSALGRAWAVDYWTLLLAVGLFGLGGPIISSGAPKLVAEVFASSERGLAMGIYMTGPAIGGVICLTLTHSVLLPALAGEWRNLFLLWAGVTGAASVGWWFLARSRAAPPKPALRDEPSSSMQVMAVLIASRSVQVVLVMSVGVFLFNHGLNNWLPELLRVGGMSATAAGYWAALPTLVGIAGSLIIPRYATAPRRTWVLLGLCLCAWFASLLLLYIEPLALTAGLILQGIARSSMMTLLVLVLIDLPQVGERRAGVASGMFFTAAEIGGVLGPLGIGFMYQSYGNFDHALGGLAGICVLLGLATLYLQRVGGRAPSQDVHRVSDA